MDVTSGEQRSSSTTQRSKAEESEVTWGERHLGDRLTTRGCGAVSPLGGSLKVALYPLHVFNHSSVDTIQPLATAILWPPPRHQPKHHPPLADLVLHHKRPPAVPQAGVPTPFEEASAEHVVSDVVADGARGVTCLTLILRNHWQFHILKEVRGHAEWWDTDWTDDIIELHPLLQSQQSNVIVVVVGLEVWMEVDLLYQADGGQTFVPGVMETKEDLKRHNKTL
ncbi:hypothetical protein INR49_018559, partial [Caranx melampygus]